MDMNTKTPLGRFRIVALLEGISYLLFAFTMPLKYMYGILEPNFYVGMMHGVLFMAYCYLGLYSAIYYKWKFGFSFLVFMASLIPFGTFILEIRYLNKIEIHAKKA